MVEIKTEEELLDALRARDSKLSTARIDVTTPTHWARTNKIVVREIGIREIYAHPKVLNSMLDKFHSKHHLFENRPFKTYEVVDGRKRGRGVYKLHPSGRIPLTEFNAQRVQFALVVSSINACILRLSSVTVLQCLFAVRRPLVVQVVPPEGCVPAGCPWVHLRSEERHTGDADAGLVQLAPEPDHRSVDFRHGPRGFDLAGKMDGDL